MRRSGEHSPLRDGTSLVPAPVATRSDWATLQRLFPYLWQYKWRVMAALAFMIGAKMANVGVPLLLKQLVDTMNPKGIGANALLVVPVALLFGYGLLRLSTTLFAELRELIFAKATEGASRTISLQVFRHLHALSLRFHLERQTGGMTRDIERGTRAVNSLISYSLYSIFPTLIEVALVLSYLALKFDLWFAGITIVALIVYISFTVVVTEWRTHFRKEMNELDSKAHSRAIDSLLNYETVKYFNNEEFEARRYDENLEKYRRAAVKSQSTLSLLITRNFRLLGSQPHHEVALLFLLAYLGYILSMMIGASGVLAILTTAIMMAHYSWYNISEEARFLSKGAFHVLGETTEAFVYVYIGFSAYEHFTEIGGFRMMLALTLVVLISRFLAVVLLPGLLKLCSRKMTLGWGELMAIWFAGSIRGAVAFALISASEDSETK